MKYVTKAEFEQRFPRKQSDVKIDTIFPGSLTLDRDTAINGIVKGNVTVKSGVQAHITGTVQGRLEVEEGSVVFLMGVIEGDMKVDGSAFVTGSIRGQTTGSDDAWLYVP